MTATAKAAPVHIGSSATYTASATGDRRPVPLVASEQVRPHTCTAPRGLAGRARAAASESSVAGPARRAGSAHRSVLHAECRSRLADKRVDTTKRLLAAARKGS